MVEPWIPSLRERLWRAMLERLQAVTVANGYEVTLGLTRRGNYDLVQLPIAQCPAALLLPIREENDAGPYSVSRRVLTVAVRVWVKDPDAYRESEYPSAGGSTASTLPERLEQTITAVARAMLRTPTWEGLAENTTEGATEYHVVDAHSTECGADLFFLVDYRTSSLDLTVPPKVLPPQPATQEVSYAVRNGRGSAAPGATHGPDTPAALAASDAGRRSQLTGSRYLGAYDPPLRPQAPRAGPTVRPPAPDVSE